MKTKFLRALFLSMCAAASAQAQVDVSFQKSSDWGSGFTGQMVVTNRGPSATTDWSMTFGLPQNISSMWGAKIATHTGASYVVAPETWSKVIPANGGSITVGFNATPGNSAGPTNLVFTPAYSGTAPVTPPVTTPTDPTPPVTTPTNPTPPTVPVTPGSPNTVVRIGNVTVTYKISSDWKSGFQGDVSIKNETGTPLTNWQLKFNPGTTISSIWNANMSKDATGLYTFDATTISWNKDIPANGTVSYGFSGAPGGLTAPPTAFAFNSGTGTPTTPTPPTNPTDPTPPVIVTPKLSVADASVSEPLTGTTTVDVAITLDTAPTSAVTVTASTVPGTAQSPSDYQPVSQTVTFAAGQTRQVISIPIASDALAENDETFTVQLTNASGATVAKASGIITIRNTTQTTTPPTSTTFNYAEALQKSLFFYDAQRSGTLPANFRIKWRGNSALDDGDDNSIDLTGGYYDAGDHVKFGLPMFSTMTLLAWGGIEYKDGYTASGQKAYLLGAVRWGADWIMKAHPSANVLYGQVGKGSDDHSFWGPCEVLPMDRPSYAITAQKPGSDLAGEAAAALAATSMLFANEDPAYAALCLSHARTLFTFADTYRGKYSDSITDAAGFYNSYSGYNDELIWAAAWLYRATGETAYLTKAESIYAQYYTNATLHWTHSWDDKSYGASVLLAELTGKQIYKTATEKWLNYWTIGDNGSKIATTPGGLGFLDAWGSLRYAANTAFLAYVYSDNVNDYSKRYSDFAKKEIDYALGANPANHSYVVGFGNNAPRNPHHRTSHGSWANDITNPVNNRHTLYGALVGGPSSASDTAYTDDRNNYQTNEVALDYNAGFTGALARLVKEKGGTPLAGFPQTETPDDEFFVEASINQSGTNFTEIRAVLNNRSAFPARASEALSFRYYVDLSEAIAAGYTPAQVTVVSNYSQGATVSALKVYDATRKIYYVEASFVGTYLAPGSSQTFKREVQFRLSLPQNAPAAAWNPSNDYSYQGLLSGNQNTVKSTRIPVFEAGTTVLSGTQP